MIVDQDPAAAMQAFMAGKIKVQGDMMKLMAVQAAVADNEAVRSSSPPSCEIDRRP